MSPCSLVFVICDPLFSRSSVLCFSVLLCSCPRVICFPRPLAYLVLASCSVILVCFINLVFMSFCFLVINTRPLHGARFGCNFARQIILSSCPCVLSEKTSSGGKRPPHLTCYMVFFSCPLVHLFLGCLVPFFSCSSFLCLLIHFYSCVRVLLFP